MNLSHKVSDALLRHQLLPNGSPLVVAVSGGADSLALLHILHALSSRLRLNLHVATLNHGLRGDDGAADVQFVQQTAQHLNVPCTVGYADVPTLMRTQRIGLETAARRARYAFLVDVARQVNTTHIAVAHHADDQAETILMHLLRGSGATGLTGMAWLAPVPDHPQFMLIRPLRDTTRAEIEAYCTEHGLNPRDDASNADIDLLRNAIRHQIFPQLQQINPQVQHALNQMADIVATEQDFIEQQFQMTITPHISQSDGRWYLPREVFNVLHPALQRRFIYYAAQALSRDQEHYSGYRHIIAAIDMALRGRVGTVTQLPGEIRVRVNYDNVFVEQTDVPQTADNELLMGAGAEVPLIVPGVVPIPDAEWSLIVSSSPLNRTHARLALPTPFTMTLRTRRTGDKFAPLGMEGKHQTIKKWMINRKIPQQIRDRIPLLIINDEVAAILVGEEWTVNESFALRPEALHIMYFGVAKSSL